MKKIFIFIFLSIISISSVYSTLYNQSNGAPLLTTSSTTSSFNEEFITNYNDGKSLTLTKVFLGASATPTTAYLLLNSTGAVLDTQTFVGKIATFNYVLAPNTAYRIKTDSGGASYTRAYTSPFSYPVTNSYINWTAAWQSSTRNTAIAYNVYQIEVDYQPTEQIQTNLSSVYATEDFSISLDTNFIVNMSIYLDNVFLTQLNNTNSETYDFSGISLGSHTLSLKSENDEGYNWNNQTFEIQPKQYFRFYDGSSYVTSYTFGGVSSVGQYVTLNYTSLDFGSNTLTFAKSGYNTEDFSFIFNNTAQLNNTYNITPTSLTVKMYDASTLTQLYFNVTIFNSTDTATYLNQQNFSKRYNETITGDIQLLVTSDGYSPASFANTLNPTTSITINGYLYNSTTADVLQFTVRDVSNGDPLENVLIELQQLIGGVYTTVSQKYTSSTGSTFFYADSSLSYKVIFTKDGYVTATAFTIPGVLTYTVELTGSTTNYDYIDGINYRLNPISNLLITNNTYLFAAFISGTSLSNSIWTLNWDNGTTIYNSSSINPTGTTFSNSLFLPLGLNNSVIYSNLTYIKDGNTVYISKIYYITELNNQSFVKELIDYGNSTNNEIKITRWFLMMIIISSVLAFSVFIGINGVNLLIVPVIAGFAYVNWISWPYAAVVIVIALIFFVGSDRR